MCNVNKNLYANKEWRKNAAKVKAPNTHSHKLNELIEALKEMVGKATNAHRHMELANYYFNFNFFIQTHTYTCIYI